MEPTISQVFGFIIGIFGLYHSYTGEIRFTLEAGGPGAADGSSSIELTPESKKLKSNIVITASWVRPVCLGLAAFGALLVFLPFGDTVNVR